MGNCRSVNCCTQTSTDICATVKKSRTPTDFGEAAEGAALEGFTILKTDPFDEVRPTHTVDEIFEVASVSLERLAAMRAAAGEDVALQVDCHGAFNVETAIAIGPELERLGVTWFEDPVRHTEELEGLRMVAEQVGIPLAAGGDDYGEERFAELVEAGVKYTMQDVMRCGGVGVATHAPGRQAAIGMTRRHRATARSARCRIWPARTFTRLRPILTRLNTPSGRTIGGPT